MKIVKIIEHGFDVNVRIKDCIASENPLLAAWESRKVNRQRMAIAKSFWKETADISPCGQYGKTAADLFVQNHPDGLLREHADLQQGLAGTVCQLR